MNDLVYGNSDVPPPQDAAPVPASTSEATADPNYGSYGAPQSAETATLAPPPTSPPPQTAPSGPAYDPSQDTQGMQQESAPAPQGAPPPPAPPPPATAPAPTATHPPGYGEETIWDPRTSPNNTNIM